MKRFFLSTVCTLAMLFFTMNAGLLAQQSSSSESDNVIIVQKIKNDDGTVTIKKKSIRKGQDAETYLEELELEKAGGNTEIVIVNGGDGEHVSFDGETVMYIRKSKGHSEVELKELNESLRELKVVIPKHDFNFDQDFDFDHDFHFDYHVRVEKTKTFLGVYPEKTDEGVLLTGVVSGTGAADAGLQADDIMTAINGHSLKTGSLSTELAKYQPGDVVTISYLRQGVAMETQAKLTEKRSSSFVWSSNPERDPCKVFLGVYVGSYGHGQQGVGVSGIVKGGDWPAEKSGLQDGDRILAIDGIPVNNHQELVTERDKHKPGEFFTFTILRDGNTMEVDAQFRECPAQQEEQLEEEVLPEQPPVEFIDNTLEFEEFTAYPNPTFGNLNVKFQGEAVPTTVMVTDINGKLVLQENLKNFDGIYNQELDISSGTPGTLYLTVRQGDKVLTKPVILLNRA